jgi:hypothetical protein
VVAVEVGQEDDLDVERVDADARQVRQQRCAGIEQDLAVDDYSAVVTLGRKRRSRAEECNSQATVTAWLR